MKLMIAQLVVEFSAFLQAEDSLPCSQKLTTNCYLEPEESVDILTYVLLKFILILSPIHI
jgi:hypothetical protein